MLKGDKTKGVKTLIDNQSHYQKKVEVLTELPTVTYPPVITMAYPLKIVLMTDLKDYRRNFRSSKLKN